MGFKFNEKDFINNNIFKYEDKLNNQFSRFQEQTPTYVTWYNICVAESTVDLGFSNVERVIGYNSPIKYNEIKNFPVYGMEAIQLSLDDDEEGLDTEYEGEVTILPDTIHPLPNDFFILEHKGKDFLFEVTTVNYDTIKSNNYYKVGFHVKYIDKELAEQIENQLSGKYTCIVDNIGTQDKCIIEDEVLTLLIRLQEFYNDLSSKYISYFYNKKYNSFIYVDINKTMVYDRYLNMFIQKNSLIYDHETHKCIYLCNEDNCCSFNMEYDNSIYKAFELNRRDRIKHYMFRLQDISNIYSIFKYFNVECNSVRFNNGEMNYLEPCLINAIKNGINENNLSEKDEVYIPIYYLQKDKDNETINSDNFNEFDKIIIKYMNDQIDNIHSIDLNKLEDMIFFDLNWFTFIKIPLVLFVLKNSYKKFIQKTIT